MNNAKFLNFIFFEFARKKRPKTFRNFFIVYLKIPKRHPHFYGHYWIPYTQKYGYRHRDSSYARAQVMANYVISMAAILNVS